MRNVSIVHLWPGAAFHESGFIVGSKAGLKCLRDCIDSAINNNAPEKVEVEVVDGEGYDIIVIPSEERIRLAVPYTETYAKERRDTAIYPWDMTDEY